MDAVEFLPIALLRSKQDHDEICARAKVLAFVGYDKSLVVSLRFFEGGEKHRDRVLTERIHFRVELEAEHAIPDIDERRAGVGLDVATRALVDRQRFYAGRGSSSL